MNPCKICGKTDDKKPMAFRGEPFCSDIHRKMLSGELPLGVGTTSLDENGLTMTVVKVL